MPRTPVLPPRPPMDQCRFLEPGEKPSVRVKDFNPNKPQNHVFDTGRYQNGFSLNPTTQSGVSRRNGGVRGGRSRSGGHY